MRYYVGVDGGSTKTTFAIAKEDGIPVQTVTRGGCSYQSIGVDASMRMLNREIRELIRSADIEAEEIAGCCIGMPCYGESGSIDQVILEDIKKFLFPIPVHIVNDVEVGWAGSLKCQEGIHIASGTGSIAFGKGKAQKSMRCGGWNEFYGDEGSCYWIGRQAMSLFSKEADGRAPKGALYEIVRRELGLINDFCFTDVIRESWAPYRWKVAAFQLYAFQAVKAGDEAVRTLYEDAARELALMVKTIGNKLEFTEDRIDVSYSGGLFQVGELILQPFKKEVEDLGYILKKPYCSAAEGALLLAREQFENRHG